MFQDKRTIETVIDNYARSYAHNRKGLEKLKDEELEMVIDDLQGGVEFKEKSMLYLLAGVVPVTGLTAGAYELAQYFMDKPEPVQSVAGMICLAYILGTLVMGYANMSCGEDERTRFYAAKDVLNERKNDQAED